MVEPGLIVLLGSGATQPPSGHIHEIIARRLPQRPRIVILETPAGGEPNAALLAGEIQRFVERPFLKGPFLKDPFLKGRLQHVEPLIDVVPARRRGTPYGPDNPQVVAPILEADEILLGAGSLRLGSPTVAVRHLRNTLALQMTAARQRRGAALVLASTAALAFSTYTLPLVEIDKEGEVLHWKQGLDYFTQYGLPLSVIPHWNNGDGGDDVDTSRGTIGRRRFRRLHAMLPAEHPILGIDEHTALIFDFVRGSCRVLGSGSVTFLRNGLNHTFPAGATFPLGLLGLWRVPNGRAGIPQAVWEQALQAEIANGRATMAR